MAKKRTEFSGEHRDFEFTYDDRSDLWTCRDLSVDAPTLSALKTKMNRAIAQLGKMGSFDAYIVRDGWGVASVERVTVISMPETAQAYGSVGNGRDYGWRDVPRVWCAVPEGNRVKRRKVDLDNLVACDAGATAALDRARELTHRASELHAQAEIILKAMRRLKPEDVASRLGASAKDEPGDEP